MYQCLRHYGFGVFMCLRVFKGSNPVSMSMLAQNRYKHTEGYLYFCTHCVMICHTDLSFSGNIQGGGGPQVIKAIIWQIMRFIQHIKLFMFLVNTIITLINNTGIQTSLHVSKSH